MPQTKLLDLSPSQPDMTEPSKTPVNFMSRKRSMLAWVLVTVLIGTGWIGVRLTRVDGGPTVLLSDGLQSPAHPLIVEEFDDPYYEENAGFDGAQFYAIARSPADVKTAAKYVDPPTYRLRRILYPAVAGLLAPSGGIPLIWAMALVSLIGVAIGGWALTRLPGAPPWLAVFMVLNPGVIAGLWVSLGDVLATGLVLAAFAAMFSRRVALAIVVLALACLTREISVLAAFALMATPGLSRRDRLLVGIVPCIPVGLWSLYVARTLGEPIFTQPDGGTFTFPFAGWVDNGSTHEELALAAALAVVLALALTRWRRTPLPVTLYIAASLAVLICSTPIIMFTWAGSTRVITAALPLAIWVVLGHPTRVRRKLSPPVRHTVDLPA